MSRAGGPIRIFETVKIVTRDEAREAGLTEYFTGVPCIHGHVAPRSTSSSACIMCRNASALAKQHAVYLAAPDEFRRYRRRLQAKNPLAALFRAARSRAKGRGIDFSITPFDLSMNNGVCPCCNREMFIDEEPLGPGGRPHSPSIDRFVPALGYVPGNVSIICWSCNDIKSKATLEELKAVVRWMEDKSRANPQQRLVMFSGGKVDE